MTNIINDYTMWTDIVKVSVMYLSSNMESHDEADLGYA